MVKNSNFLIKLIFILNSFIFISTTIINYNNIIKEKEDEDKIITPGISKTYFIQYKENTEFIFDIKENDSLQVNIHAINCNFELEFEGNLLNNINLDTYSIIINSNNKNIIIKPLIDVINGKYKENYDKKTCPLSINSFLINENKNKQFELKIENKEENIFYLNSSYNKSLNIFYDIKKISEDNFVALFFQFNEKTHFLIDVDYKNNNNENNTLSKHIYNSTNIFLNSNFLLYDDEINENDLKGILSINIYNLDNKDINIRFKIIEKDTISLFEKNAMTFGFLTSKTIYQYYYTEVFKGEEGELMLHNKRLSGILHGKIINKNKINRSELYNNTSIYPKDSIKEDDSIYLTYNQHSLQLNFSYINTSHCLNGCYLLITYEQKIPIGDFPLIGYEFSILSRFWNYTDYISEIVDIHFNEYIISAFETGSISNHYYSISIPDDAVKFIIQIEGNYLDGFYGEGRKKLNTIKLIDNTKKLEIYNPQNVLILNISELNYTEKIMSFAFRPKDYYADIYSFYYFRIFYVKNKESIYFPVDSNLGNLCIPEKDEFTQLYYCDLILNNNYNELSTKFSISSSIQNEYFTINTTKIYKNGNKYDNTSEFIYIHNELNEDIESYIFKFAFPNNETKNILSCFDDNIYNIYPQIYSSQMFYVDNSYKINYFKIKKIIHLITNISMDFKVFYNFLS